MIVPRRICKNRVLLIALAIFIPSCATHSITDVLVLPEDQGHIEQHMRAGTREFVGLTGLSRLEIPDGEGNLYIYVIDRQAAAISHVDSVYAATDNRSRIDPLRSSPEASAKQ